MLKLNSDAALCSRDGFTGVEMVIRDHEGRVLGDLSKWLYGNFSKEISQVLTPLKGLQLPLDHAFQFRQVEFDAVNLSHGLYRITPRQSDLRLLFNAVGSGSALCLHIEGH